MPRPARAAVTDAAAAATGWQVYIVRTVRGTLYTGITTSLERRFGEHARGCGARYFRFAAPVALCYVEPAPGRGAALRREAQIKRLSRAAKLRLIAARAERAP